VDPTLHNDKQILSILHNETGRSVPIEVCFIGRSRSILSLKMETMELPKLPALQSPHEMPIPDIFISQKSDVIRSPTRYPSRSDVIFPGFCAMPAFSLALSLKSS
jgi:hypothetical protein